jgi:hypothetical protein
MVLQNHLLPVSILNSFSLNRSEMQQSPHFEQCRAWLQRLYQIFVSILSSPMYLCCVVLLKLTTLLSIMDNIRFSRQHRLYLVSHRIHDKIIHSISAKQVEWIWSDVGHMGFDHEFREHLFDIISTDISDSLKCPSLFLICFLIVRFVWFDPFPGVSHSFHSFHSFHSSHSASRYGSDAKSRTFRVYCRDVDPEGF